MNRTFVLILAMLCVTGTACGGTKPECEFPATVTVAEGNSFHFAAFNQDSTLFEHRYVAGDELFIDFIDGTFRINGVAHVPQVMTYREVLPKKDLAAYRNIPAVQHALAGRSFDDVDSLTANKAVWAWDRQKVEVICQANEAWRSMQYESAAAAGHAAYKVLLGHTEMISGVTVEDESDRSATFMVTWRGYDEEQVDVGLDFPCQNEAKGPCSEDDACVFLAFLRQLSQTKEKVAIAFIFGNPGYDQGAPAERAEGR
jgi:hypothetical protein